MFPAYCLLEVSFSVINLEQSSNLSGLVYIDSLSSWNLWKTWHCHNLASQSYNKSSTCRNLQITYRYFESSRSTQFVLVVSQAVLCLSHTDWAVCKSKCLKLFCLLLCICSQDNFASTIDLLNDCIQLIFDRSSLKLIREGKVIWLLNQTKNFLSKLHAAFAAFCPYFRQSNVNAKLFTFLLNQSKLCWCVGWECINSNHTPWW